MALFPFPSESQSSFFILILITKDLIAIFHLQSPQCCAALFLPLLFCNCPSISLYRLCDAMRSLRVSGRGKRKDIAQHSSTEKRLHCVFVFDPSFPFSFTLSLSLCPDVTRCALVFLLSLSLSFHCLADSFHSSLRLLAVLLEREGRERERTSARLQKCSHCSCSAAEAQAQAVKKEWLSISVNLLPSLCPFPFPHSKSQVNPSNSLVDLLYPPRSPRSFIILSDHIYNNYGTARQIASHLFLSTTSPILLCEAARGQRQF